MIFARAAVKGKREVRRVSECRQDVPGRGDQESDEESADGPKPLPGAPRKKLFGEEKIDKRGGHGENDGDQTLQEQTGSEAGGENERPVARMRFLFVERAKEGPHGEGDGKSQHDVWDLDPCEEEQSDARGDAKSGVKTGRPCECPHSESSCKPCKADRR